MIPYIDYSLCVACSACVELFPLFFEVRDERVWVINTDKFMLEDHESIAYVCPFGAITIE